MFRNAFAAMLNGALSVSQATLPNTHTCCYYRQHLLRHVVNQLRVQPPACADNLHRCPVRSYVSSFCDVATPQSRNTPSFFSIQTVAGPTEVWLLLRYLWLSYRYTSESGRTNSIVMRTIGEIKGVAGWKKPETGFCAAAAGSKPRIQQAHEITATSHIEWWRLFSSISQEITVIQRPFSLFFWRHPKYVKAKGFSTCRRSARPSKHSESHGDKMKWSMSN